MKTRSSRFLIPFRKNEVSKIHAKQLQNRARLTNSYLAVFQKSKPLFHSIPRHDQQPGERKNNGLLSNLDFYYREAPSTVTDSTGVIFFKFYTTFCRWLLSILTNLVKMDKLFLTKCFENDFIR